MDTPTKRSLGHFPIGTGTGSGSSRKYSFIRDINGSEVEREDEESSAMDKAVDTKSPFDVTPEDIKKRMNNSGGGEALSSQLALHEAPPSKDEEAVETIEKKPSKKKVASYYLEESLTERLKSLADDINNSYSGVAAEAIELYVSERGY